MNPGLKLLSAFLVLIGLSTAPACLAAEQAQAPGELMPAFVNLPYDRNVMPDEYINVIKDPKSDLRKVAASLIERKRQFILRWDDPSKRDEPDENFPKSLVEIELVGLFPEEYLDSLIKSGQLNVHQVGHSRGVCEPKIRAHAEDFFLGIHLGNTYDPDKNSRLHYLRPKYGFINLFKPCGIKSNPYRLVQYGQILIVYNEAVKYRSTYTYGDSLASYCEPWAITIHPLDPVPLSIMRPPGKEETPFCRFVEAQIWGPIELNDIKEFRIPKNRQDLLAKLSVTGKPVFSYDREKMELNDAYIDVCEAGWSRAEPLNQEANDQLKKEKLANVISR